jgi:hypothetical protein
MSKKNEENLKKYFKDIFKDVDIKHTCLKNIEYSNLFWNEFKLESFREGKLCNNVNINWVDYINNNDPELFAKLLGKELKEWDKKEIVYFCVSRSIIIETIWEEFLLYWNFFLEFDDDSPFVFNLNKEAVFFDSFGKLSYYPDGSDMSTQ